jgi:hypothetical protein
MRHKLVVAELAATCVSSMMAIVTIAWPNWIEQAFRTDPDHRSGALESLIAGLLIAVTVASALAARAQIGRGHAAANLGDAR